MPNPRPLLLALLVAAPASAQQQPERYDYFTANREMIQRGMQALMMCSGLFVSDRTVEQVFAQELAYIPKPIGTAQGGDYQIDRERKAVAVGTTANPPVMRSAFRTGIGCVAMAPDQTFEDISKLPSVELAPPPGNPATTPWPDGDLVKQQKLPAGVDGAALQAASDWAFTRPTPEQVTLSLIVVHKGQIIHERYAPGVTMSTRTRTWSTAKSIASTLIGMLVDQGKIGLDQPLGFEWLPKLRTAEKDPRSAITLRNVLNMSSGLYPVDNFGMETATGSGLSYFAGTSSVEGALHKALVREPGTYWDYENYDTLLGVFRMKLAIGDPKAYLEYPRRALFDKIGMRNTLVGADRFGDFILSSQVYTNARDLARFGLLYQQNGMWNGQRLISENWIKFVRTPAPSTAQTGNQYGGQFWLVPDNRSDVPKDAYSTAGNRGQYVVIVPTHELVIVRRGLDYGRQGFSQWDLTREVLKAFEGNQN